MRHLKKGRKFGREHDQRRALMKSLASSFFVSGKIKTTEAKAKELRPFVESFMSCVKTPNLANRRRILARFSEEVSKKIFERAAAFKDRPGGYTRIIKTGQRNSDGARMAIFELVK